MRDEPYRLAADVWGIGFKTADVIATSVGIAAGSPERIKAGLAYTLSEAADDGHCYLPAPNLTAGAAKILDVRPEPVIPCLDELAAADGVVRETVPAQAQAAPQVPAVYLPPFYQAERSLAGALLRLHAARADRPSAFATVDWDKALGWLQSRTGAQLAPEQTDAVRLALTSKVAVLTGNPGCGKSFTVRSADPGPVRPGPASRRAGAVPGAPRPGRCGEPEPGGLSRYEEWPPAWRPTPRMRKRPSRLGRYRSRGNRTCRK